MTAHDTSEAPAQSPAVKVRRIQVPAPRRAAIAIPLLVVGVIVGVVVGGVGGTLLAEALFDFTGAPSRAQNIAGYVLVTLCIVGGAVGWGLLWERLWERLWAWRVPDRPRHRALRLQAALLATDGPERLPHRAVEYGLRSGPLNWFHPGGLLEGLQPGLTLVANGPRRIDNVWRPAGVAAPFEPVALRSDFEQLSWLIYEDAQEQGIDWELVEPHGSPPRPAAGKSRSRISKWAGLAAWMAFPVYGAFRIATGRLDAVSLFCLLTIIPLLVPWFGPLMRERTWWLVPGGLLYREFRMWRRRLDVSLFTSEQSVLFLEMKQGYGIVTAQGHTLRFDCPPHEAWITWAILSAWLSRARRPTLEEARTFIEGRGDVEPSQ